MQKTPLIPHKDKTRLGWNADPGVKLKPNGKPKFGGVFMAVMPVRSH